MLQAISVSDLKENYWTKPEKIAEKTNFGPDYVLFWP